MKLSLEAKMESVAHSQDMKTEQPTAKDVQDTCHATAATQPVEAPKELEGTKEDKGSKVPPGKQQQPMVPMTVSATNRTNDPEMTADRLKDLKSRLQQIKKNLKQERKETKAKSKTQTKPKTAAKSRADTKGKKDVKKTTRNDKEEESDNALDSESELTGDDQGLCEESPKEVASPCGEAHVFFLSVRRKHV